jgi:hypothetical protein
MSPASTKPVIFISYAHADEPDKPPEGEIQWLSSVLQYLRPGEKAGVFELRIDRQMLGGAPQRGSDAEPRHGAQARRRLRLPPAR